MALLALRPDWGTAAGVEVHAEGGPVEVRLIQSPDEFPLEEAAERDPVAHEARFSSPRPVGEPG